MLLLVSLVILALMGATKAAIVCDQNQTYYLIAIYDALGGVNWTANNWLGPPDPCEWTGISCNIAGVVTELELNDMNLVGQVPPEIGCLSHLKTIYMNDNPMNTTIPPEICQLTSLQHLQMNFAGVYGSLPDCMCDMTALKFVYLDNNVITGPIPECLGDSLENLWELHIECNQLTGSLPANMFSSDYLIELRLWCNPDFTCPSTPPVALNHYQCGEPDIGCERYCLIEPITCPTQIEVPGCGTYVPLIVPTN